MDGELQAILKVKDEFAQGIMENDFSKRRHIFTEDVFTHCSNIGKAEGIEGVIGMLSGNQPEPDCLKQNVENVITGYSGKNARQSFHMIMLHGLYDENNHFHYMQYGGTYILSYKNTGSCWKISGILYDLCWLEGNSYWVREWKMIDFHMPKSHTPVINCIRDGVLSCIPVNEAVLTDKEAIEETLYLYGWGIDTEDYGVFRDRSLAELVVEDGYHGRIFSGNEAWIEFIRTLNEKEPCLHHTYRVMDIRIDGSRATARMSRLEPNRIGSKVINSDNYFFDWFTLDYDVELVKDNCLWKLKRVSFIKNIA